MAYLCRRQTAMLPQLKFYIMTFYESNAKHGAFNEILVLMTSDKSLMNGKLFDKVFEMAIKQGETGQQLIKAER